MKKRISLFLALMLSLVALFSMSIVSVSAEEATQKGWNVTVADQVVEEGSAITIQYVLKHGDDVVDKILHLPDMSEEVCYSTEPYIEIFEGETKFVEGTYVNAAELKAGVKELTLKVYSKKEGGNFLCETEETFKLTINKKDNTMTIVMIALIVLVIAYIIWSSYSNKKKQKQAQEKVSVLGVGDKVKTIGGVCGVVKEINDKENTFILEVGEKSYVKFDKGAIYQTESANAPKAEKAEKTEESPASDVKEEKKD